MRGYQPPCDERGAGREHFRNYREFVRTGGPGGGDTGGPHDRPPEDHRQRQRRAVRCGAQPTLRSTGRTASAGFRTRRSSDGPNRDDGNAVNGAPLGGEIDEPDSAEELDEGVDLLR